MAKLTRNLSTYIAEYLKDNLFNGGKAREAETFDEQFERIIHEAIFMYRKRIVSEMTEQKYFSPKKNEISNSLVEVEKNSPFKL